MSVFKLLILTMITVAANGIGDFLSLDASSESAQKLIASSRQLEDAVEDFVAQYSIIYDGCHNTTSWDEDGLYRVVPLVRYRLCPTKFIHSGRCFSRRVGEYLVEMTTFVDAYMEYTLEARRRKCENIREGCGCDGENDDCVYHCYEDYANGEWSQCFNENQEDGGEEELMGECRELDFKGGNNNNNNNNGDNRRLDQQNGFFVGPFCGPNGNGIFQTVFLDDACSIPMDDIAGQFYKYVAGSELPYQYTSGAKGMVPKKNWVSCAEQDDQDEDGNQNNNNDADDEDRVSQMCEEIYQLSARCETNMTNLQNPDTSACTYINLIKANSGTVAYQASSPLRSISWAGFCFVVGGVAALAVVYAIVRASKRSSKSSKSAPLFQSELA